ncbi:MAG TPA: hypothetical protein DDY78_30180 [Planctomycetales bacterium]|jgi:hypothetical protein|nr:hypothetical protein [Planctomycetales bacterium]
MAQSRKDRQKQKKRKARREKIARMQRHTGGEVLVVPHGGLVSMSAALIDFMEIDSQVWPDEEQLRKVILLGMVAWNAAIASGASREDLIQSTTATLPPEVRAEARVHLKTLIQRKESLFPDNKRLMLDYRLTMQPSGPYIQIMSSLDKP